VNPITFLVNFRTPKPKYDLCGGSHRINATDVTSNFRCWLIRVCLFRAQRLKASKPLLLFQHFPGAIPVFQVSSLRTDPGPGVDDGSRFPAESVILLTVS
jgi:hypothetical protein